ncbi:MAG: nuclear transport factor 2 family protein, partial [Solirubrobacteraceae bacterium]
NSALQRARATLESRLPPRGELLSLPLSSAQADLVTRFADALERDDIDDVVTMLTEDAIVSMPPQPEWHQGRAEVAEFLRVRHLARLPQRWRFLATSANAQPAFAYYLEDGDGWARAGIFVVGLRADGIASVTRFAGDGLLERFGAPARL